MFRVQVDVESRRSVDDVGRNLSFDSPLVKVEANEVFVFFRISFVRLPVFGVDRKTSFRFRFFVGIVGVGVGVVGIFSVHGVARKFGDFGDRVERVVVESFVDDCDVDDEVLRLKNLTNDLPNLVQLLYVIC